MKVNTRKVIVTDSGEKPEVDEIARITADYITGGNPKQYCERIRARIDARKLAAKSV
jgi:hypothetical protein